MSHSHCHILTAMPVSRQPRVLSRHVFTLLKFHPSLDEIWSVKNYHFPSSSCIPEGNWMSAKNSWWQRSHGRVLQRQREHSVLGRAGASVGHGERGSCSTASFSLITCSLWFMFSSVIPSQIMGQDSMGFCSEGANSCQVQDSAPERQRRAGESEGHSHPHTHCQTVPCWKGFCEGKCSIGEERLYGLCCKIIESELFELEGTLEGHLLHLPHHPQEEITRPDVPSCGYLPNQNRAALSQM